MNKTQELITDYGLYICSKEVIHMLIVGNGHVITRDAKNQYVPDGAVAMDGMKICRVGQTAEIRRAFPDADFIDAKAK